MATRGQIPNSRVIPKPPGLRGKLGKLKQESVIKLVLEWLDNGKDCPLSHSLDPASRRLYYRGLNGGKRALYDALSYDWANGLNVLQQADIELQSMIETSSQSKWTAKQVLYSSGDKLPLASLRIHSCISRLTSCLAPLVHVHVHHRQHDNLRLELIRVMIEDTTIGYRNVFIAIPSSAPFIFHTVCKTNIEDLVRSSLATALSSYRKSVIVKSTALQARSLEAIVAHRVSKQANAMGAWSVYAEPGATDRNPLTPITLRQPSMPPPTTADIATDEVDELAKRRKETALARFGADPLAMDRAVFHLKPMYSPNTTDNDINETHISLRIEGVNVFKGLKELCESGVVNGDQVPDFLTGEFGVSYYKQE